MLYRAEQTLHRTWFNLNCRNLLKTPPIETRNESVTLVTMLCHGDVFMYLLAAKSFCGQLGLYPAIVILDDGSLTKDDYARIYSHISRARIVHISEVAPARCPKGSCWERLLLVSDLTKDSYVVQVDSDTLTTKPIPEVRSCIDTNRSFTLLGDRSHPMVESMASASARSKNNPSSQVQALCEKNFDQIPESTSLLYVRGNAGFTGFAKGTISRDRIEWCSDLMRSIVKEKWDEWGSEQVASNLLIANSVGAYPLNFPKYVSYWAHPEVPYENAAFIHFIGPHRFSNGFYVRSAKKVISTLASHLPDSHPI
jgi:hypothetical protein